jgi:putative membrane protein
MQGRSALTTSGYNGVIIPGARKVTLIVFSSTASWEWSCQRYEGEASMTLQKMAASAGLAVGLATAGWGISAIAGTAAAGTSTRAANASLAASRTAQPVSSQDRMFMDQASQINLTEISLGRYMQANATTTTAKNLGGRYARDHTAAQASLRALALRLHVTVPTTPGAELVSMVARVEAHKARNRDVAFARASVSGHQTAIAIFRKGKSAASNPEVKAYAARYLPMLQTHLRLAEHAESVIRVTPTR